MSGEAVTAVFLQERPLPWPEADGDKDNRGKVIVVGGCREVPGAALLAAHGALRAGAGKLQIAVPAGIALAMGLAMPEARVIGCAETDGGEIDPACAETLAEQVGRCDAVLIGPGMIDEAAAGALAARLLAATNGPAVVLDAAALTGLSDNPQVMARHAGRVVVTPHAGEMATFLDMDKAAVQADPVGTARRAAKLTRATVVMKGGCTHIVGPREEEVWSCDHGTVGLATSGSGDTLSGILAGLLARGADPVRAAQWAVYLHGEAGRRLEARHGTLGFLAREIPPEIPRILADLGGRGA